MGENIFDRSVLGFEAAKLLKVLLEHVNEIGRAQVASSDLLRGSGLTQGALVRARAELVRESLLRVEPGFSASGLRGANVYVLNMTVIDPPSMRAAHPGTLEEGAEEPSVHLPDPEDAASKDHRKPKRRSWKKFLGGSR
jgi:hypothetical protein